MPRVFRTQAKEMNVQTLTSTAWSISCSSWNSQALMNFIVLAASQTSNIANCSAAWFDIRQYRCEHRANVMLDLSRGFLGFSKEKASVRRLERLG